ncbi:MAG: hypothetical protein IH920_04295 [Chloroflexi bacterium]|nr:hypothetical protein [Chloroflexota bacterium]
MRDERGERIDDDDIDAGHRLAVHELADRNVKRQQARAIQAVEYKVCLVTRLHAAQVFLATEGDSTPDRGRFPDISRSRPFVEIDVISKDIRPARISKYHVHGIAPGFRYPFNGILEKDQIVNILLGCNAPAPQ